MNEARRVDSSDEDVVENFNQPDVDMIDSMLANIITPDYYNGKKTPFGKLVWDESDPHHHIQPFRYQQVYASN